VRQHDLFKNFKLGEAVKDVKHVAVAQFLLVAPVEVTGETEGGGYITASRNHSIEKPGMSRERTSSMVLSTRST
jgi:hypothetical protein